MVDAQPGDLAARRLWAYVSHAGSEQDAIQGALADCSGHDHGCRICDRPVFGRGGGGRQGASTASTTPLAFARSAPGGLVRAAEGG
jgi:hypothetical protein